MKVQYTFQPEEVKALLLNYIVDYVISEETHLRMLEEGTEDSFELEARNVENQEISMPSLAITYKTREED